MVFPPARVAAAAAAITGTVFPHYNHTDPTGALASLQGVARVGTGTAASTTAAASAVAGAATNTELQTAFPASSGSSGIAAVSTIAAGESFDGGMYLWDRSGKFYIHRSKTKTGPCLTRPRQHLRRPDRGR